MAMRVMRERQVTLAQLATPVLTVWLDLVEQLEPPALLVIQARKVVRATLATLGLMV